MGSWGSLFVEYIGNMDDEVFAIGVFSDYRQRSTPFGRSFCLAAHVCGLPALFARASALNSDGFRLKYRPLCMSSVSYSFGGFQQGKAHERSKASAYWLRSKSLQA
jgi:hypothetical protein